MINKIQHNEKKTFLSMPQCIQKNKNWKFNFGLKVFKSAAMLKPSYFFVVNCCDFLSVFFNEHFVKNINSFLKLF